VRLRISTKIIIVRDCVSLQTHLSEHGKLSLDVFVATTFIATIGIYLYFPETKGRSLEMIAKEFGDRVVVNPLTDADAATVSRYGNSKNKLDAEDERMEYMSS